MTNLRNKWDQLVLNLTVLINFLTTRLAGVALRGLHLLKYLNYEWDELAAVQNRPSFSIIVII